MRWKSFICAATAAALLGLVGIGSPTANAAGGTPFDGSDVFCTKAPVPAGTRNSSSPGVTPNSITIGDYSTDTAALKKLGVNLADFHLMYKAFWDAVNDCGGINGRKIVLKYAASNPLSADPVGSRNTQCVKLTEDFKSFVAMGIIANPNNRCIAVDHKTIMVSAPYVTVQEFAQAKGRIVSPYPAAESLAGAIVKDIINTKLLKGHTVTVVGSALGYPTIAQDLQTQYIDPLKAAGIDVNVEILPCSGSVCTQNIGATVRRMVANKTDTVILPHSFTYTAVGPLFREMKGQNLKAQIVSPDIQGLTGDSIIQTVLAGMGDAATYIEKNGWTGIGTEVTGGWRGNRIKESTQGKMCNATLAKQQGARQYSHTNVNDMTTGGWGTAVLVCQSVRGIARALYTLGNTVTTERLAAALRTTPNLEPGEYTAYLRKLAFYNDKFMSPLALTTTQFHYPCPIPTGSTQACMLPVDQPARYRTVG